MGGTRCDRSQMLKSFAFLHMLLCATQICYWWQRTQMGRTRCARSPLHTCFEVPLHTLSHMMDWTVVWLAAFLEE